jgi:hypothetical protein
LYPLLTHLLFPADKSFQLRTSALCLNNYEMTACILYNVIKSVNSRPWSLETNALKTILGDCHQRANVANCSTFSAKFIDLLQKAFGSRADDLLRANFI